MSPATVDFGYAFATPHRLTVAMPDSSRKTLLDVEADSLRLLWTDDDLTRAPLGAFAAPATQWDLRVSAEIDNQPLLTSTWCRAEGWLPVLEQTFWADGAQVRFEACGGVTAAIVRVELTNAASESKQFSINCVKPGDWAGLLPAWIDPSRAADALIAGWRDRADRVLILGLGADAYPITGQNTIRMCCTLDAGQSRILWLARPYRAYESDLPTLRRQDWAQQHEATKTLWRRLRQRMAQVSLPDPGVEHSLYAGLCDLFIMREPVAQGYLAAVPGTEVYRAPNPFEPALVAVALDQFGLHAEAARGYEVCLDLQEPNGNWSEPKGWAHHMWGASGFKAWTALEHYRLTGDQGYLARIYPRLVASSRWQERQRARTRVLENGKPAVTYGLMPRGMGDAGLKNGDDFFGVFFAHNIWAVYADKVSVQAAEILNDTQDMAELKSIYQSACDDLLRALDRGAIDEEDFRWIPGTPNKTSGSCWGSLNAAFPCEILPPDHPLISGTIRHLEKRLGPGGLPLGLGWMSEGLWVAITLDNLAQTHLQRGDGDAAAKYLYATLNHGSPLYSWCEERGPQPGCKQTSGDRQHLWTPVAVVRMLRDCLVMERGKTLHLARGIARDWLLRGPISVQNAATAFGALSYELLYSSAQRRVSGWIRLDARTAPEELKLHVRLPGGNTLRSLVASPEARIGLGSSSIEWLNFKGKATFEAGVE